MTTAEQWAINLQQYGDTFKPSLWIELEGKDFVNVVRGIQADVMEQCLQTISATLPSGKEAFDALYSERTELLKSQNEHIKS